MATNVVSFAEPKSKTTQDVPDVLLNVVDNPTCPSVKELSLTIKALLLVKFPPDIDPRKMVASFSPILS